MKVLIHLFGHDYTRSTRGIVCFGNPIAPTLIATWELPETAPEAACDQVFDLGNNPSREEEWAALWRDPTKVTGAPCVPRSFSVGDTVTVNPDTPEARIYACLSFGWKEITAGHFKGLAALPDFVSRGELVNSWAEKAPACSI
jgi:hypothetical protein